ncbi:MAG TPA: porin [Caulobacteraceae bacterium]|jgi:phosphate-selective porin OprO/OprP
MRHASSRRAVWLAATALATAALGMGSGAWAQDTSQPTPDATFNTEDTPTSAASTEAAPTGDSARATVATAPAARPIGPVDPRDEKIYDLQRRLEAQQAALDQLNEQLGDLKTAMSSGFKEVRDTAAAQDRVVIAGAKPSIQSADGRFTANLQGVMQFDAATYFQDEVPAAQTDPRARDLNAGTNFRRARIGIGGKMFGDFNYNLLYDFGGTGSEDAGKIQELWLEYAGKKPFRLRVGAFPPLVGLADATSTNGMLFLERPAPAEIARTLAGGDRRTGVQLAASGDKYLAAFALTGPVVSTLNTAASGFNTQSFDEQLGFTGRLAYTPLKGEDWRLHVGANASLVSQVADAGPTATVFFPIQLRDRPELTVDATRLVDTGAIDADGAYHLGLELGLQKKQFLLEAEYFNIGIERRLSTLSNPRFNGFYVQGSWVLSKEPRKWNAETASWGAPAPAKPFDAKANQWGAFELAARYSVIDLNDEEGDAGLATPLGGIRGGEQEIWTLGLNWYLNTAIRFMFDYQHVDIDRLNSAGLQIGQEYDAIAVRSQLAF